MNEIEYIVTAGAWSLGGFAAGWFAAVRWARLEKKVDRIEHTVEENRDGHA